MMGRIPQKILSCNPKRKRNIGRPQLRWRDQHTLFKRTEQTTYGLIHEEDDNGDDDDDDDYGLLQNYFLLLNCSET
jgi:hypothetical protein